MHKSLAKVVAGPHPNSGIRQRLFDSLAKVDNSGDILVSQRFSTENREVAMDSILFQLNDNLVDNIFSEVRTDVETL